MLIGRIASEAYVDRSSIVIVTDRNLGTETRMDFTLRRRVDWGPLIARNDFPVAIAKSLRANQTVFNIDDHWQALHHLLFPAFEVGDDLYLSFRILQQSDIPNYAISRLTGFLTEAEVFVRQFYQQKWDDSQFWQALNSYFASGQLTTTTQAQFMSEGDLWAKIAGLALNKKLAVVLIIHAMLFGNDKLGIHGIIDDKSKEQIIEFVLGHWNKFGGDQIKNELQLSIPDYDSSAISVPIPESK